MSFRGFSQSEAHGVELSWSVSQSGAWHRALVISANQAHGVRAFVISANQKCLVPGCIDLCAFHAQRSIQFVSPALPAKRAFERLQALQRNASFHKNGPRRRNSSKRALNLPQKGGEAPIFRKEGGDAFKLKKSRFSSGSARPASGGTKAESALQSTARPAAQRPRCRRKSSRRPSGTPGCRS